MTTITFDTLKYSKALKDAGFTSSQAEGQAQALSEILEINFSDLVTKQKLCTELNITKQDLLDELHLIKTDITLLKNDISFIKKILSFLATRR